MECCRGRVDAMGGMCGEWSYLGCLCAGLLIGLPFLVCSWRGRENEAFGVMEGVVGGGFLWKYRGGGTNWLRAAVQCFDREFHAIGVVQGIGYQCPSMQGF